MFHWYNESMDPIPAVPVKKPPRRLTILFPLLITLIIGFGIGFLARNQMQPPMPRPNIMDALVDDDPSWGAEDASVVFVMFGDFECPYCRQWYLEVWPQLLENYPNQVRLVYRDFPLVGIHPGAAPAAEAADCAGEMGKYWEYFDSLMKSPVLDQESFIILADQLNLDIGQFSSCINSRRYLDEVGRDFQDGTTLGISGTPTFFINGFRAVGSQPYQFYAEFIDQQLNPDFAPTQP
jgi:protein-disulfide isomerase